MKALIDYLKLEWQRLTRWLQWPTWFVVLSIVAFMLIGTTVLAPEWSWVVLTTAFIKLVFWMQK